MKRYWIAINGPSCALSSFPMQKPVVIPTPEQLVGFKTLGEAQHAQHLCLTAPIENVKKFAEWLVRTHRCVVVTPKNPQPPTAGTTMWMDG